MPSPSEPKKHASAAAPPVLLVIYYHFPPVKVPGAVRIYYLCREAGSYFDRVFGLTSGNRRFFQKDAALCLPDIPLIEVPAWDLRRLLHWRSSGVQPVSVSTETKQSPWGQWLRRLVDSFPFNILIGDGGIIYILRGYQAGKKLIRQQGVTHIFSTFRPYSDHVIAHWLKRRFPEVQWIADFRDLHLDEKHGRRLLWWPLQRWFNRWVLSRADLVTTVSSGLQEKLAPLAREVILLRNGMPELTDTIMMPDTDLFYLTYTGRIYPGEQTAALLFELVAELMADRELDGRRVRLTYAGPTPELWETWAKATNLLPQTDIRGIIPLEDARQLQRKSAINISLSFSSSGQKGDLSSKVYEYLGSGRPILAIVNGEKDPELETFFKTIQAGMLVYHHRSETARLKDFILERYRAWEGGRAEQWPKNREMIRELSTEMQFQNFFKVL